MSDQGERFVACAGFVLLILPAQSCIFLKVLLNHHRYWTAISRHHCVPSPGVELQCHVTVQCVLYITYVSSNGIALLHWLSGQSHLLYLKMFDRGRRSKLCHCSAVNTSGSELSADSLYMMVMIWFQVCSGPEADPSDCKSFVGQSLPCLESM